MATNAIVAAAAPQAQDEGIRAEKAAGPAAALLQELKSWSEEGFIRRLDSAFADFVAGLDPQAAPELILAAALVAHMEGRGHSCLALNDLLEDPAVLLGWAPAAMDRLRAELTKLNSDAAGWIEALRSSKCVHVDDLAGSNVESQGNTPLVLRGSKLYLRRYWGYERHVAAQVRQRSASVEEVDAEKARKWLDLLFDADTPASAGAVVDWQKVACAVALRGRLSVITGGPGTGKTHTAARLLALLFAMDPEPQRLRVALAAPTGKAAGRLKQSIDHALDVLKPRLEGHPQLVELSQRIGPARTLHSLLGARPDTRKFDFDAANPLAIDVLIVDEASMVHLEMMAALLAALPASARVVLLGDKDQLASVEAGAVLGDLCRDAEFGRYTQDTARFIADATGMDLPVEFVSDGPAFAQQTVMLRKNQRFTGSIGQLAVAANAGNVSAASTLLRAHPEQELQWVEARTSASAVQLALDGRRGAEGGYRTYLELLNQSPSRPDPESHGAWVLSVLRAFDRFRLLCAVRDGEWGASGLNAAVERALVDEGLLVKRGTWYEGRPVMITRNDPSIGVFNGDIGIVLRPPDANASLRVYILEGSSVRSVGVSRLSDVETAFAMTVHKAQGSEFEHTVLVLPQQPSRVLTRELVYTGITRARKAFTLVTGRAQALSEALGSRTRRSSGLMERLTRFDTAT